MKKKLEAKKFLIMKLNFCFGAILMRKFKISFSEIAFVGASNVGKSSLINALLNKKVAIVSRQLRAHSSIKFFKIFGFK